jgi:hypothetical protein
MDLRGPYAAGSSPSTAREHNHKIDEKAFHQHNGRLFCVGMTMTSRLTALLAGLLLTCSQADAGVLYSWHHNSGGPDALPKGMVMEIEFSDAAVAAGSVDYVLSPCGFPEFCGPDPDAPVTRFLFAGVTPPIRYAPAMQPMDPFSALTVSVRFEPNGYLSGTIFANDTASEISASSRGGALFTIDGVHSDFPSGGGCDLWGDDCRGATGYLRTDAAPPVPRPIPEPQSMLLVAVAMLGLLIGSRRR